MDLKRGVFILTLDPVDTEKKITKHTKAILPVHIQGFPCNMDAIMVLAKKYIMDVLSDVAEFIPSNDIEGDCGTTVAFKFETEEKARAFATANGVYIGVNPDDDKEKLDAKIELYKKALA